MTGIRQLGLFGGTFNPIHHGHLLAAQAAREQLGLDQVLFIPSGSPPLKGEAGLASGDDRLEMIRRAIAGVAAFAVSDLEVRREGKSYTLDTVRELQALNPGAEWSFLLGADCVPRLGRWKGIEELRRLVRFVVLTRAGDTAPVVEPDLPRATTPAIALSSTLIRDRVANDLPINFMTPPGVTDYILGRGLYRRPSARARIERVLIDVQPRVIACSGGIDSMLLSTIAHRLAPGATVIAHAVSPAVPEEATQRVQTWARQENWRLTIVRSGEFADEQYLSNPVNRCYFCKSNLYEALEEIAATLEDDAVLLSGANVDDLGEYRPGLDAAAERQVRHPWIEADARKADIREIAADLGLPFAAIPASPCLASRLYTGTRVTAPRLRAIERGEALLRRRADLEVVRCRIREQDLIIEVLDAHRARIDDSLIAEVLAVARESEPALASARLDEQSYSPGRAFVGSK
jgi:uncharacterized protein